MNYYIDIIDTQDNTHSTVLEKAAKNSIKLAYNGADEKDGVSIVGSSLDMSIQVLWTDNVDGYFYHFFTGDEQRYRVELKKESDDKLIWQGFLLPDSYSEPYRSGTFFVDLTAVDGLGRLQGKYLAGDFYKDEKSVIAIVSACLMLTGLQMPLVFAPAIDNTQLKKWHNIYLDTTIFIDGAKKQDAYSILQTLSEDMLSVVYQHLGYWYFEGLNKRNLLSYISHEYDAAGEFVALKTVTKIVKSITPYLLANPLVTMVPPYNLITVEQKRGQISLPDTIDIEANDGWVSAAGVVEEIYSTDWFGHGFYYAKAKAPDYKLFLAGNNETFFDSTKFISLLKKPYVKKGVKLKFSFTFGIDYLGNDDSDTIDDLIADGHWENPFNYRVKLNDLSAFSNLDSEITDRENIRFDSNRRASLVFEYITPEAGLIDVEFYEPFGLFTTHNINGVFIENASIEEINFTDTVEFTDVINADYTIDKEVDLSLGDDASGLGGAFRLGKLDLLNGSNSNTLAVPILYGFTQSGNHYSAVSLEHANLISDNIESVSYDNSAIEVLDVIYNFEGGEQMLIRTESLYDTGNFSVNISRYRDYDLDRSDWERWTDSVYEVESDRYAEALTKVYRRLFSGPEPKVDLSVKIPILFGDLVLWNYRQSGYYSVNNLRALNFDNGNSDITLVAASYLTSEGNVPPIVDAGPDIVLIGNESEVFFNASAFDPDGAIVGYSWEKVSGDSGDVIASVDTEDTSVSGLTGDAYTYRITVIDDDGLTASDTVNVTRETSYELVLDEILEEVFDGAGGVDNQLGIRRTYQISTNPPLPDGVNITLDSEYVMDLDVFYWGDESAGGTFDLEKNGNILVNDTNRIGDILAGDLNQNSFDIRVPVLFNYNNTDDIKFRCYALAAEHVLGDGALAVAIVQFLVNSISTNTQGVVFSNDLPELIEVKASINE